MWFILYLEEMNSGYGFLVLYVDVWRSLMNNRLCGVGIKRWQWWLFKNIDWWIIIFIGNKTNNIDDEDKIAVCDHESCFF